MTNKAYRDGWDRIFGNTENDESGDTLYTSQLIKTKSFQKLPHFINKHNIFANIKKIKKIFPHIGLSNCLESLTTGDPIFGGDNKKIYIGFSSSGALGLWDIATMSMRGVCSCMHWENSHSRHLIGSVTDPFLGIVYITDNENTPYGISFRRRALVRFVYDFRQKQYKLLIERVYIDTGNQNPLVYNNKDSNERAILETFKTFLTAKVGNKYPVISYREMTYQEAIPRSTSCDQAGHGQLSMSDCGVGYSVINDSFIKDFVEQG